MTKEDYNKQYYANNKDKWVAYKLDKERVDDNNRRYYLNNRTEINKRKLLWVSNNYEKALLIAIKSRSKRLGIPCNLDLEDIVIPEYCPYLGIKLTRISGKGRVWSNASVDRILPEEGYVKGNIEIISMKANTMKLNATKEELLMFAKTILDKYDHH